MNAVLAIIDAVTETAPDIRSEHTSPLMNREFYLSLKKQFPNVPPERLRTIIAEADAEAKRKTYRKGGPAQTRTATE